MIRVESNNTYKKSQTEKDTWDWKAEGIQRLAGKLTKQVDFGSEAGITEENNNDTKMKLQQQKRRWYKANAPAKVFEREVYDQLAAKK